MRSRMTAGVGPSSYLVVPLERRMPCGGARHPAPTVGAETGRIVETADLDEFIDVVFPASGPRRANRIPDNGRAAAGVAGASDLHDTSTRFR